MAHAPGNVREDRPFGTRFARTRPWYLWAEHDAALCGGLGAAARLLVAGHCGGQEDLVAFDEHLRGNDDVLMHAQGGARERGAHRVGIGQRLEEVTAARPEDVDVPAPGGLDHLGRGEARPRRHVEAIAFAERTRVLGRNAEPARECGRVCAHLRAALHAGMPADGHEPSAFAADVATRQREIDDPLDALSAADVLRDPHRPHEHGRARLAVRLRERTKFLEAASRGRGEVLQSRSGESGTELVETDGALANEGFIDAAVRDQDLQDSAHEREIPAGVDSEERVGHFRSEERAFDARRHPVVLEPRLAEGVHDQHLGSPLPREVEVLHKDGLRVRDVGTEQDDEVALDHVAVRAGGRRDADRRS